VAVVGVENPLQLVELFDALAKGFSQLLFLRDFGGRRSGSRGDPEFTSRCDEVGAG